MTNNKKILISVPRIQRKIIKNNYLLSYFVDEDTLLHDPPVLHFYLSISDIY